MRSASDAWSYMLSFFLHGYGDSLRFQICPAELHFKRRNLVLVLVAAGQIVLVAKHVLDNEMEWKG